MKFKAGDFVRFRNFEEMPNDRRYNRESNANDFHRNNVGGKFQDL